MDNSALIAAAVAGFLSASLGARMVRERDQRVAGAKPKRLSTIGLGSAVTVVMGTIGLALTGVVVVVQHEPVPHASLLFVIMLAVGVLNHVRSGRDQDAADA